MDLLDSHYAVLNSALRQTLVKSLILLRNRGHLKSADVLPLFFRLFRCQDKALRDLLFKHIVAGQLTNLSSVTRDCDCTIQSTRDLCVCVNAHRTSCVSFLVLDEAIC